LAASAFIAVFTPYYRQFEVADETLDTERSPNTARYRGRGVLPIGSRHLTLTGGSGADMLFGQG
jgi:hypothetical protein